MRLFGGYSKFFKRMSTSVHGPGERESKVTDLPCAIARVSWAFFSWRSSLVMACNGTRPQSTARRRRSTGCRADETHRRRSAVRPAGLHRPYSSAVVGVRATLDRVSDLAPLTVLSPGPRLAGTPSTGKEVGNWAFSSWSIADAGTDCVVLGTVCPPILPSGHNLRKLPIDNMRCFADFVNATIRFSG